jgi:hypothetical protein
VKVTSYEPGSEKVKTKVRGCRGIDFPNCTVVVAGEADQFKAIEPVSSAVLLLYIYSFTRLPLEAKRQTSYVIVSSFAYLKDSLHAI